MFKSIFKKKVTDEQLANIFVNGIFEVIDKGFIEVKSLIEEDLAFVTTPDLSKVSDGHFTMIVLVGNMNLLETVIPPDRLDGMEALIYRRFADVLQMEMQQFTAYFKEYKTLMNRVNHPSKVVLYSMSKAMFFKYKLNQYQDDFFKDMDTPNPLFLKRMDEIMKNFIWNWEIFFKRYSLHYS